MLSFLDLFRLCNLFSIRIPEGNILAVGDGTGSVELWDVTRTKQLRAMRGHTDRVPVLGWNAHVLASGCRNGQVWLHDVRVAKHHISTLAGHTQEVCGMAWSPENGRLLATGLPLVKCYSTYTIEKFEPHEVVI